MNFDIEGGINIRVTYRDCLYECGDGIPEECPICDGNIDKQKYVINHSIKTYKCEKCSRLFVLYRDWVYMPNQAYYQVEHDMRAVRKRNDIADEKRLDEKIKRDEKLIQKRSKELMRAEEQQQRDKRRMELAEKRRNGEPLGHSAKQRKRSFFS